MMNSQIQSAIDDLNRIAQGIKVKLDNNQRIYNDEMTQLLSPMLCLVREIISKNPSVSNSVILKLQELIGELNSSVH